MVTLYYLRFDYNQNSNAPNLTNQPELQYSIRPLDEGSVPLEPLPVSSEEDIFDYIDYDYKPPNERNI